MAEAVAAGEATAAEALIALALDGAGVLGRGDCEHTGVMEIATAQARIAAIGRTGLVNFTFKICL